jgi:hypothetical protein
MMTLTLRLAGRRAQIISSCVKLLTARTGRAPYHGLATAGTAVMAMLPQHSPSDVYVWVDIPTSITGYAVAEYSVSGDVVMEKVGSRKFTTAGGAYGFAGLLSAQLQNMFTETGQIAAPTRNIVVMCLSGLKTFFGDDSNVQSPVTPAHILNTDLLCYVRMSRSSSLATAAELSTAPSNASGFTVPRGDAALSVLSEAWFAESARDPRGVANTIYHELMHNKTRYASGEDPNWVHTPQGGGGLAAAVNPGPLASFTLGNRRAMASRLTIRNRQFTGALR